MRGKRWYGARWPRWRGVVSRVRASDASLFSSDWGFESFGICRDIMPRIITCSCSSSFPVNQWMTDINPDPSSGTDSGDGSSVEVTTFAVKPSDVEERIDVNELRAPITEKGASSKTSKIQKVQKWDPQQPRTTCLKGMCCSGHGSLCVRFTATRGET